MRVVNAGRRCWRAVTIRAKRSRFLAIPLPGWDRRTPWQAPSPKAPKARGCGGELRLFGGDHFVGDNMPIERNGVGDAEPRRPQQGGHLLHATIHAVRQMQSKQGGE